MAIALCLGLTACGGGGGDGGGQTVRDDHGDSRSVATPVTPDSDTSGVLTAGDEDWFAIPVSREGRLLVYTSGSTDTAGELLNYNHQRLGSDDDGGAGLNFRIEVDVRDFTYFVRVRGHGGRASGSYTLHVRFTPSHDVHGDTRRTATRIVPGSDTSGWLSDLDNDYFRVDLTSAGRLEVYTSGSIDTVGRLENTRGSLLASDDDGGSGNNFRIEHDLSAGTYYVHVRGRSTSAIGPYTLHVRFTGTSTGTDHGDRPADATVVTATSDTPGEVTVGDRDWFRVAVDRPGRLTVYTSGSTDTVGRLENARGNQIAYDNDGGTGSNFRIEYDVVAGTYYVEVLGRYGASTVGSYTLHVRFTPASTGTDHGDIPSDATVVTTTSDTPGELTVGDKDWFRIVVDQPGRLTVYSSGSTDTVGRLRDRGQRLLAYSNDEGSGNNFRIEHDVSAGTYYVEVLGRSSGSTAGPYTLHVRFNATPTGDDHGDTCTDGTAVDLGSTTSIELQRAGELTTGDTDYFRVTVGAGRLRAFTSGNTDTLGRVESTGGTQLASDDNGGSGSNFLIEQSVSGGTYCVRVTGAGGGSGPYTLHLRLLEEIIVGMSGDVRVNITWAADVDLDLYVTNPCGQTLGFREDRTNTCQGFTGGRDVDDQGHSHQPNNPNAENAAWPNGAPSGRYIVHVSYYEGRVPASYTVRIFHGSRLTGTYPGQLDPTTDYRIRRHVTDFTFTGSSSSPGADRSRFETGSQALSQAARSLGMSAVAAMSSRGRAPGGSSLTLAGQPVSFGNGVADSAFPLDEFSFAGANPEPAGLEGPERAGSWREFLDGSRFDVAVGEEMRAWGEARGTEGIDESRFLGFERGFGRGLVAGVAFSDTANKGGFGLAESESLEASLASAYQYLHFSPGASTELWSLVGAGEGELLLSDDVGAVATDLSMQMFAFGSRHGLAPLVAGLAPTVSADGFLVRLEAEGSAGLDPLAGDASRLRTGVLFERPLEGVGWTPRIGFGVRHEDDERGVATRSEVMAGFGYVRDRFRIDGMTHLWPDGSGEAKAGGDGPRTQEGPGARLTAHYGAAADGRGLAVSVDALTGPVPDAPVWRTDEVSGGSSGVRLQAGYGMASGLGQGRWTPYGTMQLDGHERRLREGIRHDIGAISLDLYGEHRLGATPEHGIHVGVSARF